MWPSYPIFRKFSTLYKATLMPYEHQTRIKTVLMPSGDICSSVNLGSKVHLQFPLPSGLNFSLDQLVIYFPWLLFRMARFQTSLLSLCHPPSLAPEIFLPISGATAPSRQTSQRFHLQMSLVWRTESDQKCQSDCCLRLARGDSGAKLFWLRVESLHLKSGWWRDCETRGDFYSLFSCMRAEEASVKCSQKVLFRFPVMKK